MKSTGRNITKLLVDYRTYLLSKVSKVSILGEADERELKKVFVELSIVDQSAPRQHVEFLRLKASAMQRRFNPYVDANRDASTTMHGYENETRIPVRLDELLQSRMRALVAGAPGCGKTTLLKYLAFQALEDKSHLTVWLELKAIDKPVFAQAEKAAARNSSLILQELWLRHIKIQMSLSNAEIKLLRAYWGKKFAAHEVIALLDGFDELQDGSIERSLNKCIRQFASAFYDNTLLISTRPYTKTRIGTERLQELEIEPLSQGQIAAFLNCYYPNDRAIKGLLMALRQRPSLRELLHVPLLLGIILRLYRENRFSDDRLKLYETIISDLVHKLDRSKSIIRQFKINDQKLRVDFLRFIAFERLLHDQVDIEEEQEGSRLIFSYDLLREKAQKFLTQERLSHSARDLADDALATPLLREVDADTYAFTHLTLQEYLAARAFVAVYERDESEGLAIFSRAYHNPTIVEMEVLPMMLGALSKAHKFYAELEMLPESLTFVNLRLRARGLGYGAKISQEHLGNIIKLLESVLFERKVESKPYLEVIVRSFADSPAIYLNPIAEHLEQFLTEKQYEYTRAKTTDTLGRMGGEKATAILQTVLKDKAGFVRQKAAYWLGQIKDANSASALAAALNDTDIEVVKTAAHALVNVSIDEALTAFTNTFESENAIARPIAIFWLGFLIGEEALDLIEDILAQEDLEVRLKAVEALGFIGGERALSILSTLYQDTHFGIRLKLITAIGQCGGEQAIEFLLAAIQDASGQVRCHAIDALVRIAGKRFIEIFIGCLRDPDPFVRQHAAKALDRVADRKAIPALLAALDYKSHLDIAGSHRGLVVSAVASALRHYNDDQVVQSLIRVVLEDKGGEGAASAAVALGRIGDKRTVEPLLQALRESSSYVQSWAAVGLGSIGDNRATLPLVTTLLEGGDIVQMHAARALGEIRDERAVEALLAALQYERSASEEAALALRFFEGNMFAEELAKALSHQNQFVRRKAVSYVGYYSLDLDLLKIISQLAESDVDEFVRETAAEAREKFVHKLELLGHFIPEGNTPPLSSNDSKDQVLIGEVYKIVGEAGHLFRQRTERDVGIDGDIEFNDETGDATGRMVYLQLKSGDSHLHERKRDGKLIFRIKKPRHAKYWASQSFPVMLVIRDDGGQIRWMNVTEYLQQHGADIRQIEFQGEPFTAQSVKQMCAKSTR